MKIIFVITLSCIACIFSNAQTLQVIPLQIRFNNDIYAHSNDALTISDDNGNTVELPEYSVYEDEWEDSRNTPFAYIMGQQSRTIEVLFADTSPNEYDDLAHLIVKLSVTDGNGIGTTCNIFIPNYNWVEHTIHLNSPLPDYVGKHEFTWKWEIYAIPVDEPGYSAGANTTYTTHTYYTLLDEPQAPMTEPWTSVLDYACEWAEGESSTSNVIEKVTEGIYYMEDTDGDIDYQLGSDYIMGDVNHFSLSNFLYGIKNTNNVKVNCSDCANLFNIFTSAVGLASKTKKIWNGIETRDIQPIGNSCSLGSVTWVYHHYGLYNDLVNDASLMLYENGVLKVPVNMPQSNYNSLLMLHSPPPSSQTYTTIIHQ